MLLKIIRSISYYYLPFLALPAFILASQVRRKHHCPVAQYSRLFLRRKLHLQLPYCYALRASASATRLRRLELEKE